MNNGLVSDNYILIVGVSDCWDDGIREVFGPFTEQESVDLNDYYERNSESVTGVFRLKKICDLS
jgi:hypothetical protein